jgi:regulator of protease activity HflC (stomatin/prohibitin superfamily)
MEDTSISTIFNLAVWGILFLVVIVQFLRSIRIVPTQSAYVVERLGKYQQTLHAGFHALLPFLDRVVEKLDLREETLDVPPQECFTKDEVKVEVDGVMYISVTDPVKATYGVTDYRYAAMQLAQTTTREVIGKIELDRTFEERELISSRVVDVLEEAGRSWGIRIHRYEIKNITPPITVQDAMEKQVTAERHRRAMVAKAEGDKQAMINRSEGAMQELINRSEGEMQRRVNEAEGRAEEILTIAKATADSIDKLAAALQLPGGAQAVELQLAEQHLEQLGALAAPGTQVLLPLDLSRLQDVLGGVDLGGVATKTNGAQPAGRWAARSAAGDGLELATLPSAPAKD